MRKNTIKPSLTPYLVRAYYQWIEDSDLTAYITVDCFDNKALVPIEFIQDSQIVLNISSDATNNLNINNEAITFQGRFLNKSLDIFIPIESIINLYIFENGEGITFKKINNKEKKPKLQLIN